MSGQGDDAARAQALVEFQTLTGLPEDRVRLVLLHVQGDAHQRLQLTIFQCITYLEAADWNLGQAAQSFFLDTEDQPAEDTQSPAVPDNYTGPRTLDGRPVPEAQRRSAATASKKPAAKKKGVATLGSLGSSSAAADDDDDEEDDDMIDQDPRNPRDLFAGGEKSGLAVQDPKQEDRKGATRRLIQDIMDKARA